MSGLHIDAAQSHRRQLGENECLYVHVLRGTLWAARVTHSGSISAGTMHHPTLRVASAALSRRLPLLE